MERKIFTHVVANVILLVLVVAVASVGFIGATTNVFKDNDGGPIYRGVGEKQVSLMINVYWGTEYLDEMLAIFDKYNVKTTFFVGGTWVAEYPEMLQKIAGYGHEIGNHGYHHKDHSKLDYESNYKEINSCAKLVFEYAGVNMTLFAPPSGYYCAHTLNASRELGNKVIMWSRDTIDWRDKDAEIVYNRATKDTDSGELILMHPTKHTLSALERIILTYNERGFTIVPVSTNLGEIWTSTNNTPAG